MENRISTLLSTACLLVLATIVVAAEVPQHISGPARIIDGDGLKISSWEIRLFGIDAPETRGGPGGASCTRPWTWLVLA